MLRVIEELVHSTMVVTQHIRLEQPTSELVIMKLGLQNFIVLILFLVGPSSTRLGRLLRDTVGSDELACTNECRPDLLAPALP
jgi:hypothetical protein